MRPTARRGGPGTGQPHGRPERTCSSFPGKSQLRLAVVTGPAGTMTPMDNFYRPAGGDPGDHQPTEQFWRDQGVPPGGQGPGSGYPWQPGPQAHATKDRHRAWHWTVGIALAALLAGGGATAGASLA